jgi:Domain of unknown function (DUF932)
MTSELEPYTFPVLEYPVSVGRTNNPTSKYKAIVRQDTGKLISIQRETYQLIPNKEVIQPLMKQLSKMDTPFFIDRSHSFVLDGKMRLNLVFPEYKIFDSVSDVALTLNLMNSYDGSSGLKIHFGLLRQVCTNGLIVNQILSKFYGRHTKGLNLHGIREALDASYNSLHVIHHRIETMQNTRPTNDLRAEIQKRLGVKIMKHVEKQESLTRKSQDEWTLLNHVTHYVSHELQPHVRHQYQMQISHIWKI